jgi:hypothetical protein
MGPVIKTVDNPLKVEIFIAGHVGEAIDTCRNFCDNVGLCVTITETSYVYRGGQEPGIIVGLINYPRFPTTEQKMVDTALNLAYRLLVDLEQLSFTVQGPSGAYFYSWREVDGYKGNNPW